MFSHLLGGGRRAFVAFVLSGAFLVAGAAGARAEQDIFLKFPNILGDSVAHLHAGEIDILGFSANASRADFLRSGGPAAGRAICGQITLTKLIDRTSPQFFGLLFRGVVTPGPATITFEKTGEAHYDFYKIDLFDVTVQSISQTEPKDAHVTETIVFQANRFKYSYTPQTRTGTPATPVTFGWDCQKAQAF